MIGNAAPVQDTQTGRIWLPFCRNNEEVFLTYSDDDGETWIPPTLQPQLVGEGWKWVGLGPPAGLQLTNGRLVIPSYHTTLWKGDGCASRGHTLISDDHGQNWRIGSSNFGEPFFSNECQAVELRNGSLLINARVVSAHRLQVISNDGGETFEEPYIVPDLVETIEGCEGSIVKDPSTGFLYFSIPNFRGIIRQNLTVFQSLDEGLKWNTYSSVDKGAVAYSAMQFYHKVISLHGVATFSDQYSLGLLYERSDVMQTVFEPDEILFWEVQGNV